MNSFVSFLLCVFQLLRSVIECVEQDLSETCVLNVSWQVSYVLSLMTLVSGTQALPADLEVTGIYRTKVVDEAQLQALFDPYFRFDVSCQRPFFYKKRKLFVESVRPVLLTTNKNAFLP